MKRTAWLLLLALVLAACGSNAATPTSASVNTGNLDLSGLSFEVHQEPG